MAVLSIVIKVNERTGKIAIKFSYLQPFGNLALF